MELNEFLILINRKKQTIASWLIIFIILAIILTFIQPLRYGSSANLLVIQKFTNTVDPYTASKSNEYLSNILAKVIYSNSFYNKVVESGYKIDNNYFKGNVRQQMKKWSNTVSAKTVNDTGIISLNIYHQSKSQADQIARAISYTMQTKHSLYHGYGENVIIKVIDEPTLSNFPVKPNIILNFFLAIILGFIFSLLYIYLLPLEKYDLRLWPKFRKVKYSQNSFINQPITSEPVRQAEDNWQAISQILGNEFKPQTMEPVKEEVEASPIAKKDFENEDNVLSGAEDFQEDTNYDIYNNYQDIVKQGNINNVFGKPNLDN